MSGLTCGTVRRWAMAVAVSALLLVPVTASGQAIVRAVIHDNRPVSETSLVHVSRFADLTEEGGITVGTTLGVGDLVRVATPTANVLLELACAARPQTLFRFSGAFRVVISPTRPDVPCVVQLLGGGADVRAEAPTEINAGGILLGSKGTQYAVRLGRTPGGVLCEGFVFEDDLEVTTTPGVQAVRVATSRSWTFDFSTRRGRQEGIPDAAVTQSARIATQFDLARFKPRPDVNAPEEIQRRIAEEQLMLLHVAVLKAPADAEARSKLGQIQERLGILDSARYNLMRAQRLKPQVVKPPGADPSPSR